MMSRTCLLRFFSFGHRIKQRTLIRQYTTATQTINVDSVESQPLQQQQSYSSNEPFRTSITDPLEHTDNDLGLFYTVTDDELKRISPFGKSLPLAFREECEAFNETALMIRQPSLDTIKLLKQIDWSLPPLKVLYHPKEAGVGMTLSLFHVIHYAWKNKMLLVNTPTCAEVLKLPKEATPSPKNELLYDTPYEAKQWLKTFAINNENILKESDFRTKFNYEWSTRESTPTGTHLLDLIDYATDRIKYASECVGAIVKEVKSQVREKNLKTLVTFDGVNSYFGPSWIMRPDHSTCKPDEVVMVKYLKELLLPDWNNAFIVCTIGSKEYMIPRKRRRTEYIVSYPHFREHHRQKGVLMYDGPMTIKSLLRTEGIEAMEPFVPIEVGKYTEKEFDNQIRYYIDRNWIQNLRGREEEGKKEILFYTARNPYEIMKFVSMH